MSAPRIEPQRSDLTLLSERGAAGLLRAFAVIWMTLACASWLLASNSNYNVNIGGLSIRPVYFGWLIGPIVLGLVQLDRIRQATATVLWAIALIPLAYALLISGMHNHILVVPPVAVMAAGWLLGWRHAAVIWMILAAGHYYLLLRHQAGYPYQPDSATIKDWLVFGFANTMALTLGVFTMRSFRRQFGRVLGLGADLERQVKALRSSEARFAEQFRANPLPCAIGDLDARIIDVNDAWISTFGVTRAEAIGHRTDELGLWADVAPLSAALAEMQASDGNIVRSVRLRVGNGETRDFVRHVAQIDTDEGGRYISMLVDQTDRLAAEAAQRALNVELEARVTERTVELETALQQLRVTQQELVHAETLASLGSMVAGISHELNTPLGNAVTVLTTLEEQIRDLATHAAAGVLRKSTLYDFVTNSSDMSALALRSVERAAELVRSFKQVAIDQVSERRRAFDLRAVVDDFVATLRPGLLKHQPWIIDVDVSSGIECDSFPGVLGQVLTNLVQNASLHAFTGRDQGRIRIAVTRQKDVVDVLVEDDGIGMDAATLAHIFDPFFTTALGRGGSGLGLSICRRLVVSVLGGELTATSVPGMGSRFILCLPIIAPGRV